MDSDTVEKHGAEIGLEIQYVFLVDLFAQRHSVAGSCIPLLYSYIYHRNSHIESLIAILRVYSQAIAQM